MQPDPRAPGYWRRAPEPTWWWFIVPLVTFGFGTFPMVLLGARRLRSRVHTLAAYGYLVTQFGLCAGIVSATPNTDGHYEGSAWMAPLLLLIWVVGVAHVAVLQTRVRAAVAYPPPPPPHPMPAVEEDPALTAARWRARRREEARALQAAQPSLASELMIGRPDLPHRQYDDGGLIDVNHVTAEWMASGLQIDLEMADRIVEARTVRGGFASPDELIVYCDGITPERLALFRDRMIFVPR
jgi:hypothetical protein